MKQYLLHTPRLILRPLTPADAEEVFVWCSDPLVNRFMPYALYTKEVDVRNWLKTVERNEDQYEFGFVCKENNRLIGSGGIGPAEDKTQWEIGYNLRSDCWNQGYATEATKAMIDFAYREFGVHEFGANHAVENPASGRVMEKCGMHFDHYGEYSSFDGSETFQAKFYKLHLD